MINTNTVCAAYRGPGDPYDFQVNDLKSLGKVDLKAVPYNLYTGRVRVKGNESPLRIEL